MANNALRQLAQQGQAGADAVGGVVHGRQAGPVIGPAVHVLLMAAAQELDASQFALVVEFLHKQVFPAVNDGLHHHVDLAGGPLRLDQLFALLDGGGHGHGAGDVFAGLERRQALGGVVGDGRVDVHGVDRGVLEHVFVAGVASLDAETVAALVQLGLVAAANGGQLGVGVCLVDGDELGAETEPDDADADLATGSHGRLLARC